MFIFFYFILYFILVSSFSNESIFIPHSTCSTLVSSNSLMISISNVVGTHFSSLLVSPCCCCASHRVEKEREGKIHQSCYLFDVFATRSEQMATWKGGRLIQLSAHVTSSSTAAAAERQDTRQMTGKTGKKRRGPREKKSKSIKYNVKYCLWVCDLSLYTLFFIQSLISPPLCAFSFTLLHVSEWLTTLQVYLLDERSNVQFAGPVKEEEKSSTNESISGGEKCTISVRFATPLSIFTVNVCVFLKLTWINWTSEWGRERGANAWADKKTSFISGWGKMQLRRDEESE